MPGTTRMVPVVAALPEHLSSSAVQIYSATCTTCGRGGFPVAEGLNRHGRQPALLVGGRWRRVVTDGSRRVWRAAHRRRQFPGTSAGSPGAGVVSR